MLVVLVAEMALAQGNALRCARLWGSAARLLEQVGESLQHSDQATYGRSLAAAQAAVDETVWAAAWNEGYAISNEALLNDLFR